jgi:hypothetical protein
MKDHALIILIRRLLEQKSRKFAEALAADCGDEYRPIIKEILERLSFGRTKSQNSLLHQWFHEIAQHRGDVTALDVKGETHRDLGLHIRLRDPQFNWVWQRTGALLDFEKQPKILTSGVFDFSSAMSVKELSEYMDEISRKYEGMGVRLTHPGE